VVLTWAPIGRAQVVAPPRRRMSPTHWSRTYDIDSGSRALSPANTKKNCNFDGSKKSRHEGNKGLVHNDSVL